jgi:hypothetical protein
MERFCQRCIKNPLNPLPSTANEAETRNRILIEFRITIFMVEIFIDVNIH